MDVDSKLIFNAVKPVCVPLLKYIRMAPENYPQVLSSLNDLLAILKEIQTPREALQEPLIKYIFFPISEIIRANDATSIPDHIMERILQVTTSLLESWWWSIDTAMWKGLLVFSSSCLPNGDPDAKRKTKARDEETQAAALRCLWGLLHNHGLDRDISPLEQEIAKKKVQLFAATSPPLLAQILTSLLLVTTSRDRSLQLLSLQVIQTLVEVYFGEAYAPNILPGVISKLSRMVMKREGKTHQQGDIVKLALQVMQTTIILGIGDEVCIREGVVRIYNSLDDFSSLGQPSQSDKEQPMGMAVKRTSAWLNATASQLHNALNTFIPPLTEHPTPSALEGLLSFCQSVLLQTSETLPQSQPLLLIPLLTLTLQPLPSIAEAAQRALLNIFNFPNAKPPLLNTFTKLAQDNLSTLPRLLVTAQDHRLTRCVNILIAIASLSTQGLTFVAKSIARILGPSGGIEKWGWGILDGLELALPNAFFLSPNTEALLLQGANDDSTFPTPSMRHVGDPETQVALVKFFRTWGEAAGDEALFAVEWFVGYASKGSGNTEVSALWCGARLLEGIANAPLSLGGESHPQPSFKKRSTRLKRHARWLTKLVSSFWERDLDSDVSQASQSEERESNQLIEYVKGMQSIERLLDMGKNAKPNNIEANKEVQRTLYLSQALQLLAIASSILETPFSNLLIHALYPVLHSFVSPEAFLSSTAHAALLHISLSCGFATPSNLLLSNFDYALNSVSRHLTRQRLDMAAPKVLVILVKLVGRGVVDRAGDVVEECFERLGDYHGYGVVVEGLVEVLGEVVRAVERERPSTDDDSKQVDLKEERKKKPKEDMQELVTWYQNRNRPPQEEQEEEFGPYPRRAWGDKSLEEIKVEEEAGKKTQDDEPKLSPTQKLIQQIVLKSIHFLTHPSAIIRSRILSLLASSISTLSSIESSILPAVHIAWPFILNRLRDSEVFVVVEAAELVSALVENVGDFVDDKIWNDIWPLSASLISKLEKADKQSALSKRLPNGSFTIGTQSIYTSSHRLYSAILCTITKAIMEVGLKDKVVWDVLITCRRFISDEINEGLQDSGKALYIAMAAKNADAVWLVLGGAGEEGPEYLYLPHIRKNAEVVFNMMG